MTGHRVLNAAKRNSDRYRAMFSDSKANFFKNIADLLEVLLTNKHPKLAKLFNLRSCVLHVAHGAIKTDCTKAGFDSRKILNVGSSHLIMTPPVEKKNSLK